MLAKSAFGLAAAALLTLLATAALAAPRTTTDSAKANILSEQAMDYFKNGQFALAAELYRKAFRLDPGRPEYLFGVGRSEQKAGRLPQARAAFDQVVALLPVSEPLAVKAQKALEELAAAPTPAPAAPAPAPAPVAAAAPVAPTPAAAPAPVVASAPPVPIVTADKIKPAQTVVVAPAATALADPIPQRKVLTWTGWGIGTAGLVGALAFGGAALSERSWLEDKKQKGDSSQYDPARINASQITNSAESVNARWTGAAIAGGVGVVGAGLATWLTLTAPKSVVVAPLPGGVQVSVAF